jgi:hypothetical protein
MNTTHAYHAETAKFAQTIVNEYRLAKFETSYLVHMRDVDTITLWRNPGDVIAFTTLHLNYETQTVQIHAFDRYKGPGMFDVKDAEHLGRMMNQTGTTVIFEECQASK